jgi:hypothetical protein
MALLTSFMGAGLVAALRLPEDVAEAGLAVSGTGLLLMSAVTVDAGALAILNLLASISNIPGRYRGIAVGGPISIGCLEDPPLRALPPLVCLPVVEEPFGEPIAASRYPFIFFSGASVARQVVCPFDHLPGRSPTT